ncbi:hypothetical protein ACFXPX_36720 [Kitasatospora sp. NPDC059146]|uniref:hypothetical protein n=1 Tax=unclassified Kitasatospora TaxID=2633591 RepID=UPI0036CC3D1D
MPIASLPDGQRAKWLADHLTERRIPAAAIDLGGQAAAEVQITVNHQHHTLYLALDQGLLLWQLVQAEGGEVVFASSWTTTPGRSAQRVASLLATLGAELVPVDAAAEGRDRYSAWMLGGPPGAGYHLYRALQEAEYHPDLCHIDHVPTITVGVTGGQIRITGKARTLGHSVSDHAGWVAVLSRYSRDERGVPDAVVYDGSRSNGPWKDTARCVAAVGALVAVSRHRRTTTVGARIREALTARGIPSGPCPSGDGVRVALADGSELVIIDPDGGGEYQPKHYWGTEVWRYRLNAEGEAVGHHRILTAENQSARGLEGLTADLPQVLDVVESEAASAGGAQPV